MVRDKLIVPAGKSKPLGRSRTVPDQSLTIREIVDRFTRGIPASGKVYDGVYIDQDGVDLERLARMGSVDKAYEAEEMRAENEHTERLIKQAEERRLAAIKAQQKAEQEASKKASQEKHSNTLDNTMLDDTSHTVK